MSVAETNAKLVERFNAIRDRRPRAIQERLARVTLGSSMMRAFAKKTSDAVRPVLASLDLEAVAACNGPDAYRRWFEKQLDRIAQTVLTVNPPTGRPGLHPGYKWGHSAKILNSFMQHAVRQSRYFSEGDARRIEPWLYVPLDSVVMKELRACGIPTPLRINRIDSAEVFYRLQDIIGAAAAQTGISRILFDDVWAGERPL